MSLPWNKSLQLHVGLGHVTGVLRPAWSSHRILARSRHDFARPASSQGIVATAASAAPCRNAIEAVLTEMRGAVAPRRAIDLRIVLPGSRVHFDVVSGDYGGASDRHLQSIATACVVEMLGDAAAHQMVRWQLQRDMRHLLIASMDTEEVEDLIQVSLQNRYSLQSVQPDFCTQWNHHIHALQGNNGVFASLCETHLVVAYVVKGSITALSCGPIPVDLHRPPRNAELTNAVDARVDRLLSSVGQTPSEISTFILVAPEQGFVPITARWTLSNPSEDAA